MTELIGSVLSVIVGNHYRAHHKVTTHKLIAQAEHIFVVGDTEVCTNLVLLDIISTDDNQNLNAVAQLSQHAELRVGLEAWKHAGCMMIVEELASQLHIQFSIELSNAFLDVFRLNLKIFVVVETYFHIVYVLFIL